jgi:hypothetical protein
MPDEFYVGYLPLPAKLKRFLLVLVPALVVGVIALSATLTSQQNAPGNGTWDLGQPVTLTGTFRADPYALLSVPGKGDAAPRQVLLVTMGKVGGDGLDLPEDGATVSVTGYPIARGDGAVLLTVETPGKDIAAQPAPGPGWTPKPLGPATLAGQIIDPKCYFGAMKPGEGKVHKACATLCIKGGIPPMFMTTDPAGERTYYLLLDADGNGIVGDRLDTLLPFVADPVRIAGQAGRVGNLLVFRIDTAKIKRM